MEYCRKFDLTIHSATNLENVRTTRFLNMEVYAKVVIGGNKRQRKRTPVDKHGHTNPAWHHTIKYAIDELGIHHHGTVLVIKLYCNRLAGDRYIGEVHKSLKELYDNAYQTSGNGAFCSAVQIGSAVSQGQLYVSYSFGERESMENLMRSDYLFINSSRAT